MAMMKPLDVPDLGLSDAEAELQFEKLQARLVPLWESVQGVGSSRQTEQTIVVVPSQTIDFDCKGAEMQAYEERMLYLLMLLRQPRARVIYATSQSILPTTLDYYMSLMPGVITSHAMSRFYNVAPEDRTPRAHTTKLLERPQLLEKIRSLINDPTRAYFLTKTVTMQERDIEVRRGSTQFGSDPSLFYLGSKTGSREVFSKAGVSYPIGLENLRSMDDVRQALLDMCERKPLLRNAMVKLNDGISGEGNAVVELEGLPDTQNTEFSTALEDRLQTMLFESSAVSFESFGKSLGEMGGIAEERIEGRDFCSPSVQMRVSPLGDVEILSTHDQLLGGPSGQSFLGSQFPANPEYGPLIAAEARKIGERLADYGALGRFAVDFVVVRNERSEWESYAIEINLRIGGTTHPFEILQFLTDGSYVDEEGLFRAPSGKAKYYVASDHLESTLYRAFTPTDLFDILIRHGLHFDQSRQTGVLVHMLATAGENGRFGVVAVGDSPEEAQRLYQDIQEVIKREAEGAIRPRDLRELV